LELSVLKCCSPSHTPILLQISRQSTPVVHISRTVSTVQKVLSHSICTLTFYPQCACGTCIKCPSLSMTPGPLKLNKQSSHLAVAEKAGSFVCTPILLQNIKWDSSVPMCFLSPVPSQSTPTSVYKMWEVQVFLSRFPSPSMTLSPSK
uniref:Uncharacterized protein n=1 Tax=Amphimedon queenslandica TaxID=400682 RepID=A0A1X7VJQ5_AMPQE